MKLSTSKNTEAIKKRAIARYFCGIPVKQIYAFGYYLIISLQSRVHLVNTLLNIIETFQILHLLYASTVFFNSKQHKIKGILSFIGRPISNSDEIY